VELASCCLGTLEKLCIGLLARDHIAMGAMEGGRKLLAQISGLRVDGEAREPAMVRLVQPVTQGLSRGNSWRSSSSTSRPVLAAW
jgi:hypothetical protein